MKAFTIVPIVLAMTVLAILVCGSLADDSSDSTAADNVPVAVHVHLHVKYSSDVPVAAQPAGKAAEQGIAKVDTGGNGAVTNSKVADRMDVTKAFENF